MWKGNINPQDVCKIVPQHSFWRDAMFAWTKLTYSEPESFDQIQNQSLWFNSAIKTEGKIVCWKKWSKKGINSLAYLKKSDGLYLDQNELEDKYNIKVFITEFLGLKAAIPSTWENNTNYMEKWKNWETIYQTNPKPMSAMYRELNSDSDLLLNLTFRWKIDFKEFDIEKLKQYFRNIQKITNFVKLRSFQYRILCKLITLNKQLKQFKIITNEQCTFCNDEKETLLHFFWKCPAVYKFWEQVRKQFFLENNICMNVQTIIFNNVYENPKMFTVPSGGDGFYYFSVFLVVINGEYGRFDIQINGETFCSPYTDQQGSPGDPGQAACGATTYASAGSLVLNYIYLYTYKKFNPGIIYIQNT